MVGLDKFPGAWREPTDKDLRWHDRQLAFAQIEALRDMLYDNDKPEQRDRVALQIEDHFSIWMKVFSADADMKMRIIRAANLKGTDTQSFDASGNPVHRPGGAI
jgi:hypothetical protein